MGDYFVSASLAQGLICVYEHKPSVGGGGGGGWVAFRGMGGVPCLDLLAGAGCPGPFTLPIPKLRSCCSAETAYEQQLCNLGMGRVKGV